MNNKYQKLINYDEIKDTVDFYNSAMGSKYSHAFKGMNVYQAIEYWKSLAKKTDKIESSLEVYLENFDLLYSDVEKKIITYMLNHPEKDRFRLIHDGSYYSHRIWFHVDKHDGKIHIRPEIDWAGNKSLKPMSNEMSTLPPEDKVQFLLDNFEVVYIQMNLVENRSHILGDIRDSSKYNLLNKN